MSPTVLSQRCPSSCLHRAWRLAVVASGLLAAGTASADRPTFTDVTQAAGVRYQHNLGNLFSTAEMGGGAAAGDFDGDGWVDLFVTRLHGHDLLFRNQGDGTFADATHDAFGADPIVANTNGATFADIDNDADLDLYVTALDGPQHYLYVNDGTGQFTEQAVARRVGHDDDSSRNGFGAAFGDYDHDGYLDLATTKWAGGGTMPHLRLFRNRGDADPGVFDDVTDAAGVRTRLSGFTPRFSDLDRDGRTDLLVAADFFRSRLFWNDGDGTFTNGTDAAMPNPGGSDMGLALGDLNGDGLLDWFVSNIHDPANGLDGNRLWINNGDRTFTDATDAAGVRAGGWGWGTALFDYDHDRDLDLVLTNGFPALFEDDPMRLWENDGGFPLTDVAPDVGLTDTGRGTGLLTFDYDRDGDLDLFIVHNDGEPILYRNDGGNNADFLQVELRGVESNRFGVGAWLELIPDLDRPDEKLVREITTGPQYLAQSEMIAHFGLGDTHGPIDLLRIEWPSGHVQELTDLTPNQRLTVVETPEPTTALLLGLAGLALARRHRTRTHTRR